MEIKIKQQEQQEEKEKYKMGSRGERQHKKTKTKKQREKKIFEKKRKKTKTKTEKLKENIAMCDINTRNCFATGLHYISYKHMTRCKYNRRTSNGHECNSSARMNRGTTVAGSCRYENIQEGMGNWG